MAAPILSGLDIQTLAIPASNAGDSGQISQVNNSGASSDLRAYQGAQRINVDALTETTQAAAAAQSIANKSQLPSQTTSNAELYKNNYIASTLASQPGMGGATATIGQIQQDPGKAGMWHGHIAGMHALGNGRRA